ncbi:MAG: class I SAM-dependent methyltransferase [Planctomycetes bacterium]|nr:class I SAM-dependent methyltransferase [Planctomycetota bacterium]
MSTDGAHEPDRVDHYGASYGHFATELLAAVRADAFGEDIGQNGWLTADEQDAFVARLAPTSASTLLDVACGSGGPTLRIARSTGCRVHGVDAHGEAIARARAAAESAGLGSRAAFTQLDAAGRLPFADGEFDRLTCIDALNHLPDRRRVFAEWARVLRRGARLLVTDPVVITGAVTNEELAIRASIGFFLFVPDGLDERWLTEAGFRVESAEDRTENMARVAERWHAARARRARELCALEGEQTFAGQQRFFEITARLASERRLKRQAFCAIRE